MFHCFIQCDRLTFICQTEELVLPSLKLIIHVALAPFPFLFRRLWYLNNWTWWIGCKNGLETLFLNETPLSLGFEMLAVKQFDLKRNLLGLNAHNLPIRTALYLLDGWKTQLSDDQRESLCHPPCFHATRWWTKLLPVFWQEINYRVGERCLPLLSFTPKNVSLSVIRMKISGWNWQSKYRIQFWMP